MVRPATCRLFRLHRVRPWPQATLYCCRHMSRCQCTHARRMQARIIDLSQSDCSSARLHDASCVILCCAGWAWYIWVTNTNPLRQIHMRPRVTVVQAVQAGACRPVCGSAAVQQHAHAHQAAAAAAGAAAGWAHQQHTQPPDKGDLQDTGSVRCCER